MEFVSTKYPELDLSNKPGLHGVRFRDGRCTVTRQNAISILQSKWWQRRGVRVATDEDAAASAARPVAPPVEKKPETPKEPVASAVGAAEPESETVPEQVLEPVPSGTSGEVLAWVGGDQDRARQALDTEQQRDKPRSSLVAKLEKLAE